MQIQAAKFDPEITICPDTVQLSNTTFLTFTKYISLERLHQQGIFAYTVSVSLAAEPYPVSKTDLDYIEHQYVHEHISSELMSRWFGCSISFMRAPLIGGHLPAARLEFSKILVQIKQELKLHVPVPMPPDVIRLITSLGPKPTWGKSRHFFKPR
jgi:hypothetical protein